MVYEQLVLQNVNIGDKIFYINTRLGSIERHELKEREKVYLLKNLCLTEEQAASVMNYNKLINISKWLNKEWAPDWKDINEKKYFVYYNTETNEYDVDFTTTKKYSVAYFKTEEIAKEAISMLHEWYLECLFEVNTENHIKIYND